MCNVETEPKTKWCGGGETEPMENFTLGKWNISVGLYEKIEKWPPFDKY